MEKSMEELTNELRESTLAWGNAIKELQAVMVERGFTTWEAIEEAANVNAGN
jgi:hypothetical protein